MDVPKNLMHNDALQLFNEKLLDDVLTIENVISKKRAISYKETKIYGYFLEKNSKSYFLQDYGEGDETVIDKLPIKVLDKEETDYNKDVFYVITKYASVKIPIDKRMEFRVLIDVLAPFSHTNPKHFLLYKILSTAAYCSRTNYRAIAERGFGKDSVVNNMRDLVGSISNIYGATYAKLEYSLKHKYIIFNEMGNLKAEDKYNMQQFLLAVGAFFNRYTKKSRAGTGTLEEYDISKTSLTILYNPPQYYVERGQEFFDIMFTQAVSNRFIPFYFEGVLNESFDSQFDVSKVVDDNLQTYKDVISTIRWYRFNDIRNKYPIPEDIAFDDDLKRFERTFLKVADYISEYAEDESEYLDLLYELWSCYKNYDRILKDATMGMKIEKV